MGTDITARFYQAIETVLAMKLTEFMEKYRDLLPRFALVEEEMEMAKVLDLLRSGKHYIIVVDKRNRVKGIISYIDFMLMFGRRRSTAMFAPFSSVSRSLRRSRMPYETLIGLSASDIMTILPPHLWTDSRVEDALKYMSSAGTNYAVVTTREGVVVGIVTAHAIFRAVLKEAGFEG